MLDRGALVQRPLSGIREDCSHLVTHVSSDVADGALRRRCDGLHRLLSFGAHVGELDVVAHSLRDTRPTGRPARPGRWRIRSPSDEMLDTAAPTCRAYSRSDTRAGFSSSSVRCQRSFARSSVPRCSRRSVSDDSSGRHRAPARDGGRVDPIKNRSGPGAPNGDEEHRPRLHTAPAVPRRPAGAPGAPAGPWRALNDPSCARGGYERSWLAQNELRPGTSADHLHAGEAVPEPAARQPQEQAVQTGSPAEVRVAHRLTAHVPSVGRWHRPAVSCAPVGRPPA